MRARVHVAKGVGSEVGVDLRRRHRRVAEQLLHDPHIRPSLEQVRRERVSERVGRNVLDPGALGDRLQDEPRVLPAEPAAASTEEQRRRRRALLAEDGPAAHEPGVERTARKAPHGHEPLLVALAGDAHDVLLHVVDVERDELGDAGAGRIEELEQRTIAQLRRRRVDSPACSLDERRHLVDADRFGQPLRQLRRPVVGRDILGREPLLDQVAMQPPNRAQMPCDARGRQLAIGQRNMKGSHVVSGDVGDR